MASAPFQGLLIALSAWVEMFEVISEFMVFAVMSAAVYPVPVIWATCELNIIFLY